MSSQYDPNYVSRNITYRIGQKAILVDEQNRILLLLRSHLIGGKWSLPGGGLEPEETIEDSIKREIVEETGLVVSRLNMLAVFSNQDSESPGVLFAYYSSEYTGELILNWEHDEYRWLTVEEALSLELIDHAKKIIELYKNHLSMKSE